jgi:hypothetical protein
VSGPNGPTKGQCDALLDFGAEVILFEFKHFLLRQDTKDSLDRTRLEAELRLKLVEDDEGGPKALLQLAKLAAAVRQGRIPTVAGASVTPGRKAILYPVVVVAYAAMEAFGINKFLNDIFQEHTAQIEGEIRPLTVMSVQELEEVLAYTRAGVFSWPELLDTRFDIGFDRKRVRLWSVHQAIYDLISTKRAASVANEFRKAQFDRIATRILSTYSGETTADPN